jgi:hypothetical protein
LAAPGLAITAPEAVDLGSMPTGGGVLTARLGAVTVTTGGLVGDTAGWTATVTATVFSTGGGGAGETVSNSSETYWSGEAAVDSGHGAGDCAAGQADPAHAVALGSGQVAFSCDGVSTSAGTTLSWDPTLTVSVDAGKVVGTYSGTVTHSVS